MPKTPLTVCFTVSEDEIWEDPNGDQWIVSTTCDASTNIMVRRTITQSVPAKDLVREWRKLI